MHELSIALSIIDIAEEEAQKANAHKINEIELEIGTLSGIELSALEFAFETATEGTMLENAKVRIEVIEAEGFCNECRKEFILKYIYDSCPFCNGFNIKLLKGKELKLKSLNVD